MRPHAIAEPIFEPPPQLSLRHERRLSGRAVAVWQAACRNGKLPFAADFALGELAVFCADSSVGLIATTDGVIVSSVGATVATTFGLACRAVTRAKAPLGARLGRAFGELRRTGAPVSFEASFRATDARVRLTRGVVLPLLDTGDRLTQALAIVTWKEILGDAASDLLDGEISDAVAAAHTARQGSGPPPLNSLYATFGTSPDGARNRAAPDWPVGQQRATIARQPCYRAAADA